MARDPVCGMEVNETEANDTSQYQGRRYYFCSPGCRSQFDRNPARFTGEGAGQEERTERPMSGARPRKAG